MGIDVVKTEGFVFEFSAPAANFYTARRSVRGLQAIKMPAMVTGGLFLHWADRRFHDEFPCSSFPGLVVSFASLGQQSRSHIFRKAKCSE